MIRKALLLSTLCLTSAFPAILTLTSQELHLFADSQGPTSLSNSSPEFFTNLDAGNLGSYGWQITNQSAVEIVSLSLLFFLDAEWDLATNLVSNEYADFLGLGLPGGAPPGALAPDSWEIDEPGYVFGDIYSNVSFLGSLDNTNAVPSSAPDDVSLAYRWTILNVAPGETIVLTIHHFSSAITGIGHFDPDSLASFYVSGYLERSGGASPVPEPAQIVPFLTGLSLIFVRRLSSRS